MNDDNEIRDVVVVGAGIRLCVILWPAAPGRVFRAPWSLVSGADPMGGDATVEVTA